MDQDQTIIKVGNSLGATFPKDFVDENNIRQGGKVRVSRSHGSITYTVNFQKTTEYEEISDKEFLGVIKDVETRYGNMLDDLANL